LATRIPQVVAVLRSLFGRRPDRAAVRSAYDAIVARARAPVFFMDWGVPDTLDGRFEVLALHAFLVLHRLKQEHAATAGFAQAVFDAMFADMDRGLREMGASDLGVGRRVKEMAMAFYGRVAAYEKGLAEERALLAGLRRNLFGTAAPEEAQLAAVADYVRRQVKALAGQSVDALLAGCIGFAPLEEA
jgi:cytochrome b pre-mRNA-processing protein 3